MSEFSSILESSLYLPVVDPAIADSQDFWIVCPINNDIRKQEVDTNLWTGPQVKNRSACDGTCDAGCLSSQ